MADTDILLPHPAPKRYVTLANELKAAAIGGACTLLAGVLATAATLYTAYYHIGEKEPARPPDQQGLLGTISTGQLIVNRLTDPSVPLDKVLPVQGSVSIHKEYQQRDTAIGVIANGSCTGLDNKLWKIQIAPVAPLRGKDSAGRDLNGYNVNLRLTNISDRTLYLKHRDAEATDQIGDQFTLQSTNLPDDNLSAPVDVSPGADLPVNLKYLGQSEARGSVSFSVTLHITSNDDKVKLDKQEPLACTNMPVESPHMSAQPLS